MKERGPEFQPAGGQAEAEGPEQEQTEKIINLSRNDCEIIRYLIECREKRGQYTEQGRKVDEKKGFLLDRAKEALLKEGLISDKVAETDEVEGVYHSPDLKRQIDLFNMVARIIAEPKAEDKVKQRKEMKVASEFSLLYDEKRVWAAVAELIESQRPNPDYESPGGFNLRSAVEAGLYCKNNHISTKNPYEVIYNTPPKAKNKPDFKEDVEKITIEIIDHVSEGLPK